MGNCSIQALPVYELGQFSDERPFFTMKLVKGKTLAALLSEAASRRKTISPSYWESSNRSAKRWPTLTPRG